MLRPHHYRYLVPSTNLTNRRDVDGGGGVGERVVVGLGALVGPVVGPLVCADWGLRLRIEVSSAVHKLDHACATCDWRRDGGAGVAVEALVTANFAVMPKPHREKGRRMV